LSGIWRLEKQGILRREKQERPESVLIQKVLSSHGPTINRMAGEDSHLSAW